MPRGIPGKPIINCKMCEQEKMHYAKGLCRSCYNRQRYPKIRKQRQAYARHYYQEHRTQKLAGFRRYREEHYEERVAYDRRYYQEHQEERKAYQRNYGRKHRGKIAIYMHYYGKRWRQENPEKMIAKEARRRAQKKATPNTLTSEQAEQLFAIGQATYPDEKLHLDHVVPLSKSGGTTLANMHAIPASLNYLKQDMLPEESYKQETLPLLEK